MKKENKAQIILIFITMIWGVGFPLTSLALKDIGPFTLVAAKSLVAVIALFIAGRKSIKLINKKLIISALIIAVSLVTGNLLQAGAMVYTTPSKCSFITGLTVVFVPILMTILYKDPPTKRKLVSIGVAIIGLLLLTYNGDKGINVGDLLTLLSAFVYSFQVILVHKYGSKYDGIILAGVELVFVTIFSLIPAILLEGCHIGFNNNIMIVCILVTGVLGSGLGMAAQNKMQPYLNPSHAALIYLCEPVFGAFFSMFIGDILSPRAIVGAILILAAMFLESR